VTAALVVLAIARAWARRPVQHGPTMTSVAGALGWFLVLFLVPALPLRYGFIFGTPLVSALAGAAIVADAVWRGWDHRRFGRLGLAALAGLIGAAIGYLVAHGYPEARLLAAGIGFLLAGTAVCAALDKTGNKTPANIDGPGRR
jgi:peptidoglycan/LPS O-acetylase OafA/YrhL